MTKKRKLHHSSKNRIKSSMFYQQKRRWKPDEVEMVIATIMALIGGAFMLLVLTKYSA